MSGIFQSPSDGYEDVPLEEDEHVLRRQAASYVKGGLPVVGGQLVVTNRRVLFRPLDTTGVNSLLQEGFDFLPEGLAQFGRVATKLATVANEYIEGKAGALEHRSIIDVQPGRNASWLSPTKPPTLLLTTAEGHTVEIGVVHSIGTPNPSSKNTIARDETITAIREAARTGGGR